MSAHFLRIKVECGETFYCFQLPAAWTKILDPVYV